MSKIVGYRTRWQIVQMFHILKDEGIEEQKIKQALAARWKLTLDQVEDILVNFQPRQSLMDQLPPQLRTMIQKLEEEIQQYVPGAKVFIRRSPTRKNRSSKEQG